MRPEDLSHNFHRGTWRGLNENMQFVMYEIRAVGETVALVTKTVDDICDAAAYVWHSLPVVGESKRRNEQNQEQEDSYHFFSYWLSLT
jgi:hypothetical protein